MTTTERSIGCGIGARRRVLRRIVTTMAVAPIVASCSVLEEPVPVQQVNWRNGPYAVGCGVDGTRDYADGRTVQGESLSAVGYVDLDGRDGDEAVLTHGCAADSTDLSVWTGSEDGPELLGPVEAPVEFIDVRGWEAHRGRLCVLFNTGDTPGSGAEARPVAVTDSGLTVLADEFCEVDGVSKVERSD